VEVRFLTERAVEPVRQPVDLVSIRGDRQDVDFRHIINALSSTIAEYDASIDCEPTSAPEQPSTRTA